MSPCWRPCCSAWAARCTGRSARCRARRDDRGRPRATAAHRSAIWSRCMRASVLLLGALLARCGEAASADAGRRRDRPARHRFPCRGPARHGRHDRAQRRHDPRDGARTACSGADILLPQPSVGATENLLLAAVAGERHDDHPQCGPRAGDRRPRGLPDRRWAPGSRVSARHVLTIEGGAQLAGAVHARAARPHRVRYACLCRRRSPMANCSCRTAVSTCSAPLRAAVRRGRHRLMRDAEEASSPGAPAGGLRGIDAHDRPLSRVRDRPAGADDGAADAAPRARARSPKTVFEQRFRHVGELAQDGRRHLRARPHGAGAGRRTGCRGPPSPAPTCAPRPRSSWPAWAASGETSLDGLDHLDRGYDGMAEKLVGVRSRHRSLRRSPMKIPRERSG